MSKVVKGIGKAVKSIGKAIKKVASSKVGKALLIAATIYVGGAALGAWSSPFQSINGVLAGGAKASTAQSALAAGNTAGTAAGTTAAANSVGPLASGYVAPAAQTAQAATSIIPNLTAGITTPAAATATSSVPMAAAPAAAAPAAPAASAAGGTVNVGATQAGFTSPITEIAAEGAKTVAKVPVAEAPKGIISRLMSGVQPGLDFMSRNPMPTAMMLSAAGSAAAPDEIDIIREQENQQQEQAERDRLRREKNLNLAGISLNMNAAPVSQPGAAQPGIINRARGLL